MHHSDPEPYRRARPRVAADTVAETAAKFGISHRRHLHNILSLLQTVSILLLDVLILFLAGAGEKC